MNQVYLSKKAFQILLSASVFSIIFSHSSLLPLLLHSFGYYLSRVSDKLYSYSSDRHYIFLLCNGILVVIIKNSGLVGKSPLNADFKEDQVEKKGEPKQSLSELVVLEAEAAVAEVEEAEKRPNVTESAQEEEEDQNYDDDEEEEEEGGEIGFLSAEELHKKCDEFIRRMKEGIKTEQLK